MELLIPGLILVALMAYASTRIKKSAAKAYEAETVETDEFIIQKPAGFLIVIGGDPQFAFEAYSKEFGGAGADDFRKATAKLRIYDKASEHEIAKRVLDSGDSMVSDLSEVIAETRYRVIETGRSEKGVEFRDLHKIGERNTKTYELKISALAETTDDLTRNIEVLLSSFELKSELNPE